MFSLCDDGTMDTVFECSHCGKEIRYSEVERDSDGDVPDEEISRLESEHAEECEGPEDTSHYALASRWHRGQWSSLYAFLSSGTVTPGLELEILSCVDSAKKQKEHHMEISSLEEFAEWAKAEEEKKFPSD